MPDLLRKRPFRRTDLALPSVQDFYCGDKDYEREVADWIKSPMGVWADIERYGCEVWLYFRQRGRRNDLVGYGSLSRPNWIHPVPGERFPNLIPNLAVQRRFQGQPQNVPAEDRYANQLLGDLILEASNHTERSPHIILYVHPNNARALHWYETWGFEPFSRTYFDRQKNVVYVSRILDI